MAKNTTWKDIGGSFIAPSLGELIEKRHASMYDELTNPDHKAHSDGGFIPDFGTNVIKKNSKMNIWTGNSFHERAGATESYEGESSSLKEVSFSDNAGASIFKLYK